MSLRISVLVAAFMAVAVSAEAQHVQARSTSTSNLDASVPPIAGVRDTIATLTLDELGWRAPVTLPGQPNPYAFLPPLGARAEGARQDRAEERQVRRFRAREVCSREPSPTLIEACFRCAERGEMFRWIERGDAQAYQRLRELASIANQTEGAFRCRNRQLHSTDRIVGELYRRDQERRREVSVVRTDLTQLQQAQGAIEPRLVAQVTNILLGAMMRDRLERELEAQERRAADCEAGRMDVSVLSAADRHLPEAPETMVFWSEADIRARGYRPRRPRNERPDCGYIRRSLNEQRRDLDGRLRDGTLPTAVLTNRVYMLYQEVLRACNPGVSLACGELQAQLSTLFYRPANGR